jgi:U3 small nucleolar RNA-associated protein 10
MVSLFDKTSVAGYYTKVFELCLAGFDIRRKPPSCLSAFVDVETSIISLFCGLVMKLNEKTFKPLFVRILEWAETEVDNGYGENENNRNIDRNIVFYRVVYQLTDKLR